LRPEGIQVVAARHVAVRHQPDQSFAINEFGIDEC
jgi:hypothetical protein